MCVANASPHVIKLWLVASNGMLPEKYLHSYNRTNPVLVSIEFKTVTMMRRIRPPSAFEDITGFRTVVSVCLVIIIVLYMSCNEQCHACHAMNTVLLMSCN